MLRSMLPPLALLLWIPAALAAQVDCDIVFSLGRVQTATDRLATAPSTLQRDRILGTLSTEMRRLDAANVGFALRDMPAPRDRDMLLAFLADVGQLLDSAGDADRLDQATADPQRLQRAAQSGLLLARLDCDGPAPGVEPGADSHALGPSPALRQNQPLRLASGIAGAIALAATVWGGWIALQRAVRRHDRRIEAGHRHMTRIPATLRIGDRMIEVVVIDLSRRGAKLRLLQPGPLTLCGQAAIRLGADPVPAAIRWSNAYFAGLQFDRELPQASLELILSGASWR